MKVCNTCGATRPLGEFHSDKNKRDGKATRCKACVREYFARYYAKNKQAIAEQTSAYKRANPAVGKKAKLRWQSANRDKHLASRKAWHDKRYAESLEYRLSYAIRTYLRRTVDSLKARNLDAQSRVLPYTAEQLKQRIEMNFQEGMSWENHGEWHIDHRIPVAVMVNRGERRPEVINCLANLVPLWKEDNLRKGARYAA